MTAMRAAGGLVGILLRSDVPLNKTKKPVSIGLDPEQLAKLDRWAAHLNLSRSATVARLLDRAGEPSVAAAPKPERPIAPTQRRQPTVQPEVQPLFKGTPRVR